MSQSVGAHSKTATALFAAGGLLLLGAGGAAALPFVGQAALGASLVSAGLTPGLLGLGGACFIGLGAATRALGGNRGNHAASSSALDQLAAEISTLRTQFQLVRDQQSQILAMGQAGAQIGQTPTAEQTNAMFRIAASLDQLGARLDTGFKTHFASVDEKLNILARVLAGVRDSVQRTGGASEYADAPPQAAPQRAAPQPARAPAPAPQHAPAAPRATAGAPQANPNPRAPLPAPSSGPSLGILDHLGDHTTCESSDEPTLIDLGQSDTDGVQGGESDSTTSSEANVRGSRLDSLLPDDSVRRALGS